ncbi:MAG: glutamate--tRNA ligase [Deltaproteobacteria bacterium]|nr:glutamate--tRNA ligase [Deltaproteobacteria bacterium]
MSSQVRVRFAPSPTGYLHVGGARTVLFNWLYAKHTGGKFILRIEDTDQDRSTRDAERMQIEDIKWLGFDYDEGPEVEPSGSQTVEPSGSQTVVPSGSQKRGAPGSQKGGPYAPYRQSERLDIYATYAKELLDSGRAYPCFCSDEILDEKRAAAMRLGTVPQYDGTCRKITREEAARRVAAGEKPTMRFKAPVREYKLQDAVRGAVVFPPNMVGDFVVLRSGGMPVYNFCCVVDDHLMEITHVLRAEEHLSNTVRQMMLYETFGWKLPVFAHCSLILGQDRTKLSKRHGATSVHQYAEEGYLPEALKNFLALLGWSSPEHKEILTLDEMIAQFGLERLNKAPSVFDPVKLKWMNGQYIKALPLADVTGRAIPFLERAGIPAKDFDRAWLERAFDTIRGGLETLAGAPKAMEIFSNDEFALEEEARKVRKEAGFAAVAGALREGLAKHEDEKGDAISEAEFQALQEGVKTASGTKGKALFMPMRVALTGQTHGPELKLVVPLLGAKRCLKRVKRVLAHDSV